MIEESLQEQFESFRNQQFQQIQFPKLKQQDSGGMMMIDDEDLLSKEAQQR
jgi:hypothetical protein